MKKRGQVSLDNPLTDELVRKRKVKKILTIGIIIAILVILLIIGVLAYIYFKSPEKRLGLEPIGMQ